mmetsp:Transcript_35511/g.113467  ORF Transcript_35511/g.113467 Transcript_35511/m.113467 type:complete len:205 (+) Transcript_35511:676-1290(+)
MPASAQAVTRAMFLSWRWRRLAAVVMRRAPVAPKGWPREREPPWVLTLSKSISPTLVGRCWVLAKWSEAMAVKLARTWPAKASWISTTSTSLRVSLFLARIFDVAYVGPRSISSNGSTAAKVKSRILALGAKPRSFAFSSDMRRHTAAPSVRNEEFAAVCVPSGPFTKAGFSFASCSGVETRIPFSVIKSDDDDVPGGGTSSSS